MLQQKKTNQYTTTRHFDWSRVLPFIYVCIEYLALTYLMAEVANTWPSEPMRNTNIDAPTTRKSEKGEHVNYNKKNMFPIAFQMFNVIAIL